MGTKKALIVVDMQNDFITGSLKNDAAAKIIPFINEKIKEFNEDENAGIIFTRDSHFENYLDTLEGKHLPVKHCIYGSEGWQISPEINVPNTALFIDKQHFGYDDWTKYLKQCEEIYICGTVTSICVASQALVIKAQCPYAEVYIYEKGCAGLSEEDHNAAIKTMEMCQCNILR